MKNPFGGKFAALSTMPVSFKVLLAISVVFFSYSIMGLLGVSIASLATGLKLNELVGTDFSHNGAKMVTGLKIMQVFVDIGLFVIPALLLPIILLGKNPVRFMGIDKRSSLILFVVAVLMALTIQPVVDLFSRLNEQIRLPHFLEGLQKSIEGMDENNSNIMKHLLNMPTTFDLVMNVLIVAVLPAMVEELFFRGFLQRILQVWLKRKHLAVFIAAFIFTLIHREFDKFLPLFLLGLLLGYAYLWSGDLKLPMAIHFTNNLLSLLVSYHLQKEGKPYWIETSGDSLPVIIYILSIIAMAGLLYFFKFRAQANNVLAHESDKIEPER